MAIFGHVHELIRWVLILISNRMTMKKITIYITLLLFVLSSCVDDLNVKPLDPQINTADKVYADEANYEKGLLKIYSVLAMSGQEGAGSSDIDGLDPGNAQLYRSLWNLQVVSTDECINAWQDPWVPEINHMNWTAKGNEAIEGVYQRCMFMVALANEYLEQTTDAKLESRGIREEFKTTVHGFRSEARFVRALAYYFLMDIYGRPPFITESNYSSAPSQLSREELFNWIEKELKEVIDALPQARTAYGRADKGVAYALLSRMYLNAEVYTGKERYTDCIAASKEVMSAGYALASDYANLFRADNNETSASEMILPIVYEGAKTQTYGGIRFLIAASRGASEASVEVDGVKGGWSGNRALPTLVYKFEYANANLPTAATIIDKRGIFFDKNRSIEIADWLKTFETQGWAVYKYTNIKSDGTPGSNSSHPDTDIPLFRLAEIYLNYAEAVKRGGAGGDLSTAVELVNKLRDRAYGSKEGRITAEQMTLDFLLDERSRELYWEATRRTDLVRYDYFTTSKYLWQFKGGVKNGTAIESYRNIYPIPSTDLSVNVNLTQNEGYQNQ